MTTRGDVTHKKHGARTEDGFTLVEILIAVVLLGGIVAAISSALITAINAGGSAAQKVRESTDAQLISTYLVRDAQAAGGADPTVSTGLDARLGVFFTDFTTPSTCTVVGTPVVRFKWIDHPSVGTSTLHVVTYGHDLMGTHHDLNRRACEYDGYVSGSPTPTRDTTVQLAQHVAAITPTRVCVPTAPCADTQLPQTILLTIEATNNPSNAPGPYTYTLTAMVRPQAMLLSGLGGPAGVAVPLLALGGGSGCPVVQFTGASGVDVEVNGAMVVNGLPSSCGANNYVVDSNGNPDIPVSRLYGNGACNGCTPGTVTNGYGTIPNPFAGAEAACPTAPDPVGTVWPPGVYRHVSAHLTSNITLSPPGLFVFCDDPADSQHAALDMSGNSKILGPGAIVYAHNSNSNSTVYFGPGNPTFAVSSLIADRVRFQGSPTVVLTPVMAIVTLRLPPVTPGVPYTAVIDAVNGILPYHWPAALPGLPPGLTWDQTSHTISGTTNVLGNYPLSITMTDSAAVPASSTRNYVLSVAPSLTIDTLTLPNSATGVPYGPIAMAASGGAAPLTWFATGLPTGVTIDANTGVISGTPTVAGVYSNVSVTVTDVADRTVTANYSVVIGSGGPDTLAPTVVVTQSPTQADPARLLPIHFLATFNEAVFPFAGGVTVGGSAGHAGATVAVSQINASTYDLAVAGITTDGTVNVAVNTNATTDLAGNGNVASAVGPNVVLDRTPPTVTVAQAAGQADPTTTQPVVYTATFSEPVGDLTGAGVSLYSTIGNVPATATVTRTSPTTFDLSFSGITGDGVLSARVNAGATTDVAGNLNAVSTSGADNSITADVVPPTLLSINLAGSSPTRSATLNWTITFSEPVSGLTASNFALSLAGVGGPLPVIASVTPTGAAPSATWTVSVNAAGATGSNSGSIGLNLVGPGTVADVAAHPLATATLTGQAYVFDTTAPTLLSIVRADPNPTHAATLSWTATFSEPVSGLTNSYFQLVTSGGIGGTAPGPISAVPVGVAPTATWTMTVSTAGTTGANGATIALNQRTGSGAADAAGNALVNGSLNGQAYTFDSSAPNVVNVSSTMPNGSYGAGSVIPITVTFSEPVVVGGSMNPQLALSTGSPLTTTLNYSGGSGTAVLTFNYTVAANNSASPLNYPGTSALTLNGSTISDSVGNSATLGLPATGSANSLSGMRNLVIDTVAPTVTVEKASGQADPTFNVVIHFTATFSEPVTTPLAGSFVVSGSASHGVPVVTQTNASLYDIAVSATSQGSITLALPAGATSDAALNGNQASTSVDNSVLYDSAAPLVTVNQASGQADPTTSGTINFTVTFTEPIAAATFTPVDITLGGTANRSTATVTVGLPSGNAYPVSIAGLTSPGTITASMNANAVTDLAGNGNAGSTSTDNSVLYDAAGPTQVITLTSGSGFSYLSPSGVIYYRGASGSFTLTSTLTDPDSGPLSADFPALSAANWTHAAQANVTTPGAGVYTSTSFTWSSGASVPSGLTIRGRDMLGNFTNTTLTFAVDNTAPTAPTITYPVNGASYNNVTLLATISGTANDTGSGVASTAVTISNGIQGYWNGTSWQPAATSVPAIGGVAWTRSMPPVATLVNNRTYTVSATTTDNLGNVSSPSAGVSFVYDTVAPTVAITSCDGGNGHTNDIKGSSTEISGTLTVRIFPGASATGVAAATISTSTFTGAGPSWSWVTSTGNNELTKNAQYTAQAVQVDAAGNSSAAVTCSFNAN